jgi:bifunctional enzyme CysN/CysC
MLQETELIESDIITYLKTHEYKSLLRFITCGSVDDGKSTLIGRLLYESKLIYEDQLQAIQKDSKKVGTQGDDIDLALLVDGLEAEREQGITIDVAYRYFSTNKRKFIVADTPGHEQYTRNMATGASTADLAILIIDARHGVLTQTKRHSKIVSLLGVQKICLAINKMDLVEYKQEVFEKICKEYQIFADKIGINDITAIPISALKGDNITQLSDTMPWYQNLPLISFLETVQIPKPAQNGSFAMPVQWVNRPNLDFRGFAGQVVSGGISEGSAIKVLPSGKTSTVQSIVTMDGVLESAQLGQSITLTLNDEIDISRGDMIVAEDSHIKSANEFKTTLLWMSEDPMVPNKQYWIKFRAKLMSATLSQPAYKLDINTLEKQSTADLDLNEIGQCTLYLDHDVPFEPYQSNHQLGSFIIIDRHTNNTVGMGLIEDALSKKSWVDHYVEKRSKYWVDGYVDSTLRAKAFGHKPLLIIFTGNVNRETYSEYQTQLEKSLFDQSIQAYRYGAGFMGASYTPETSDKQLRHDIIQELTKVAYACLDAGLVFITGLKSLTTEELDQIKNVSAPHAVCVIRLDDEKTDDSLSVASIDDLNTRLVPKLKSYINV